MAAASATPWVAASGAAARTRNAGVISVRDATILKAELMTWSGRAARTYPPRQDCIILATVRRSDSATAAAGCARRVPAPFPDAHSNMPAINVSASQKARILAEALPFIRGYHAKTLIIRFGGGAMADAGAEGGFARDVALLRLVGMNPIVVHGGGWRIDELLQQMGMRDPQASRHPGDGRGDDERRGDGAGRDQPGAGRADQPAWRQGGGDRRAGRALHSRAADGAAGRRAARARPDLGLVGDVERIDPDIVNLLLSRGFVPVIMPIGVDADGTAYHINSDIVAGQLARTLHAEKLILMTNVPGVFGRDGKLAYVLTASEAEGLLNDGTVQGGMRPRLMAALAAVREGVRSVHIIDGGVPERAAARSADQFRRGHCGALRRGPHFLADSRSYFAGTPQE